MTPAAVRTVIAGLAVLLALAIRNACRDSGCPCACDLGGEA